MARAWLLLACTALTTSSAACGDAAEEGPGTAPDASLIEGGQPLPDTDSGGGSDGGADAKPEAGDGGAVVVLTEDFENPDLTGKWDVLNVCTGCTAGQDMGAFLTKTPAIASMNTAFAHIRTTVPGAPTRVRLSFDATFPSVTLDKGSLGIASVDVSMSHFFSLYLRDVDENAPAASLDENGGPSPKRHLLTGLPPANTKTRVMIDVDLGGGTASVAWGSTVVLDKDPIGKTIAADPTIRVGLMYVFGPQDPFEARFDDVLLEYFY